LGNFEGGVFGFSLVLTLSPHLVGQVRDHPEKKVKSETTSNRKTETPIDIFNQTVRNGFEPGYV